MKGSVRKRGDKWSYYFTIGKADGKRKIKEKGGFNTKKEAQSALREALRKFETEGHVTQATTYTLSELIDYWYNTVAITYLKYETLVQYKSVAKNHIKNDIGYITLDKVSPIILQEFFLKKQQQFNCSYNEGTVKVIKNLLSNVFKFAHKQKLISSNPLLHVEFKSQKDTTKKDVKVIPPEILMSMEENLKGTRYYIPFLIALHTGARRGEVLGLTIDDIDFTNNTLSINKALQLQKGENGYVLELVGTKTKSSVRAISMTTKLANELREHIQQITENKEYYGEYYHPDYDFICCNEDGSPINPLRFSTFFIQYFKKYGGSYCFHDLRHTHASLILESGVNIKVIQQRLGHSEIGTTLNTYSHVTNKLEDEAMEKINERLK